MTGMCAVAGSSRQDLQRLDAADAGQVDVHQDDVRQRGARNLDAAIAVPRAQQADVGPARDEILDQHQVGRIVLDVEQGAQLRVGLRLAPARQPRARPRRRQLRFGRQVQLDPEHAALPDGAFHADDAAHQFDQPLAHHQADAGAFLGVRLLPETVERLEQLRQLLRRQALRRCP